jgi:rhamnose transport system permease protein
MVAIAITALMAVGQTFVILMKHVDLSVGSTLGLSAYLAATAVQDQQDGGVLTVLMVGLVVGVAVGVVNGALVAFLRLPALVVTLGTLYVVKGIQAVVVGRGGSTPTNCPARSSTSGGTRCWACRTSCGLRCWPGWPAPGSCALSEPDGTCTRSAATDRPRGLAGIPVWRREMFAFVVSGATAGLAGALYLARFGGVDANAGSGYELPVVAACVVGGVAITGGVGTVIGALLGAALLKTIGVSLSALSVPEFWQQAVNGALLLLAIAVDKVIADRRLRQTTEVQEVPA